MKETERERNKDKEERGRRERETEREKRERKRDSQGKASLPEVVEKGSASKEINKAAAGDTPPEGDRKKTRESEKFQGPGRLS